MTLTRPKTPPTLEERLTGAATTADAALSVFRTVAADLVAAADVAEDVAAEADAQAGYLLSVANGAEEEARGYRAQASKILDAIGESL